MAYASSSVQGEGRSEDHNLFPGPSDGPLGVSPFMGVLVIPEPCVLDLPWCPQKVLLPIPPPVLFQEAEVLCDQSSPSSPTNDLSLGLVQGFPANALFQCIGPEQIDRIKKKRSLCQILWLLINKCTFKQAVLFSVCFLQVWALCVLYNPKRSCPAEQDY